MEVILLEPVRGLGEIGAQVSVKNGYARNYLLPRGLAARPSPEVEALVAEKQREYAERLGRELSGAKARAERLEQQLVFKRLCSTSGKLYGSVNQADIAGELSGDGITVEKSEVILHGVIKRTGQYRAQVSLHPEVEVSVLISVIPDGEPQPEFEIEEETKAPVDAETETAADADSDTAASRSTEVSADDIPDSPLADPVDESVADSAEAESAEETAGAEPATDPAATEPEAEDPAADTGTERNTDSTAR